MPLWLAANDHPWHISGLDGSETKPEQEDCARSIWLQPETVLRGLNDPESRALELSIALITLKVTDTGYSARNLG
jgi:hypothetical protein